MGSTREGFILKRWFKFWILIAVWVYQQFVLQPNLWSAKDDLLVMAGIGLSIASLPFLYCIFKWSFKTNEKTTVGN
jgi:hypothetical protein